MSANGIFDLLRMNVQEAKRNHTPEEKAAEVRYIYRTGKLGDLLKARHDAKTKDK